jgi:hypothetical protein
MVLTSIHVRTEYPRIRRLGRYVDKWDANCCRGWAMHIWGRGNACGSSYSLYAPGSKNAFMWPRSVLRKLGFRRHVRHCLLVSGSRLIDR